MAAMKRGAVVVFLLLGTAARAASADEKKASIATSLITPFFGAYYLEGKVRASRSWALVLNTSYLTMDNGAWKVRAGTVGAGVEYFFQGDALRRWYVEAIGELWLTSSRHAPSGETAPFGVGTAGIALVGYQLVFDRGPVIDLGVGVVAFHVPGARVELAGGPASSEALTAVYPAAKIIVGWAF
jgi:hypothetical protein